MTHAGPLAGKALVSIGSRPHSRPAPGSRLQGSRTAPGRAPLAGDKLPQPLVQLGIDLAHYGLLRAFSPWGPGTGQRREGCVTDVTGTRDGGAPGAVSGAAAVPAAYRAAVADLQRAYAAIPPGSPVRLAKRTSNLFRFGGGSRSAGLDVSAFGRVLRVDPQARTALVGGMTTYEDLADATLRHGLMPLVVPQLKTSTVGGVVTGLGIESSTLRSGMPHESVTEMEILTG